MFHTVGGVFLVLMWFDKSIMYTIIKTRMNLVYTITLLLQFNVCLIKEYLTIVRYTLRYLNNIRNLKLFYSKE